MVGRVRTAELSERSVARSAPSLIPSLLAIKRRSPGHYLGLRWRSPSLALQARVRGEASEANVRERASATEGMQILLGASRSYVATCVYDLVPGITCLRRRW